MDLPDFGHSYPVKLEISQFLNISELSLMRTTSIP